MTATEMMSVLARDTSRAPKVTPVNVSGWNGLVIGKMNQVDVGARFISPAHATTPKNETFGACVTPTVIPKIATTPTTHHCGRDTSRPYIYAQ